MTNKEIENLVIEISDKIQNHIAKCEANPNKREEFKQELKEFTIDKACVIFCMNKEDLEGKPVNDLYRITIGSHIMQTNRKLVACFLGLLNLLNIND